MAERCADGLDYEHHAKQINYTAYLLPTMDAQIDLKAKSQAQRPNKDNVDLWTGLEKDQNGEWGVWIFFE